ncbi:hypothetical protein [Hymenobacter lapidiphilus]|uniref:Uncharacterized protein n=1 Tax=Hymenobacter lapidiphilus TaxID=2608003 RepID=A0A7Y7PNW4_9BACT|nr:hypothetical protein [Hymenobacter lapidiphilus]NVO31293.1 hypothetical protein [Hymenobacter lapidiphilus]
MLLLPLPRRHRRPLLLPPGLLALAWLLWLGCMAVPQVRGVGLQHVMEVNFLPLDPKLDLPAEYRTGDYNLPYSSPATIAAFRPWQIFAVTGNLFEDYFALRNAQAVFHHLQVDPNHDRGLQVHFSRRASYSSLVQLLDWCNVYSMKKYWVDLRHEPTAFYTFTTKSKPIKKLLPPSPLNLIMCASVVEINNDRESPSWLEAQLQLWNSDWRNSVLLLLLLGAASAYRLGWGWEAH